jgi:guanylate kinase
VIDRRLAAAKQEISRWEDYNYVLVNDDLDKTFAQLRALLAAERLKRERQVGLSSFVAGLLGDLP